MKTILTLSGLLVAAQLTSAANLTVTTADNASPPEDGQTSLYEAIQSALAGDTIQFNLTGPGPHVIQTPLGGYPLITVDNLTIDGYSQPGAAPNTNPILAGNNARIKIVLDSTGTDSAPGPGGLPMRRSTRLDFPEFPGNTGFGDSENAILGVFEADNVTIRGLSFIARHTAGSTDDPSIYCVGLVRQAMNARIQGCWFGLAPGGTTQADIKPGSSAVAAFRWRIGGDVFSEGLIFGTDGDGVNDRAEFNVALGCRIALALELPRARISGNYFNLMPNGTTFVDVDEIYRRLEAVGYDGPTVENIENGRLTDDTLIGTNGDGVSDADERNIFGHAVYDHDIEFYSNAQRAIIAGNYFGVGVDGASTPMVSTNVDATIDLLGLPGGSASARVGSDGDGVSDDLEGNVIWNVPGIHFLKSGVSTPILARGNRMRNNNFLGIPFADGENSRSYVNYYGLYLADPNLAKPALSTLTDNLVSGSFGLPNAGYPNTVIDVYLVDSLAMAKTNLWPKLMVHPRRLLASYVDNGPQDRDPDAGEFAFDLSSMGLAAADYVAVAVSYSSDAGVFKVGTSVTSPMSNPIAARPSLWLRQTTPESLEVLWPTPEGAFRLQGASTLGSEQNWQDVLDTPTHTDGSNLLVVPIDPFSTAQYYRLVAN